MFLKVLRYEAAKCFGGGWFFITICIGAVYAALAAWLDIIPALNTIDLGQFVSTSSSFCAWMPVSISQTVLSANFMFIAPILAALPFAWSHAGERYSGYEVQIACRARWRDRVLAKAMVAFASGFVVVALPLALNFLFVSCFLPAITPVIEDEFGTGIMTNCLLTDLFYSRPLLYVLAFTVLDGVLAGVWSVFVLGLSYVISNRVVLLTGSFMGLFAWQYVTVRAIGQSGLTFVSVDLLSAMRATYYSARPSWISIGIQVALLLSLAFVCASGKRVREVI